MPMAWKLRLFWYRLDKAALAGALFVAILVGVLASAAGAVFTQRDAQSTALRQFHARSLDCLARDVYFQRHSPKLPGVLYFHATYVRPDWSKQRERVARIGRHVFYR